MNDTEIIANTIENNIKSNARKYDKEKKAKSKPIINEQKGIGPLILSDNCYYNNTSVKLPHFINRSELSESQHNPCLRGKKSELYFSAAQLLELSDIINSRVDDRVLLYNYLTKTKPLIDKSFIGVDINGNQTQLKFNNYDIIHNPPEFDNTWYLLNETKTDFTNIPFQTLPSFNVSSYYRNRATTTELAKLHQRFSEWIEQIPYQTRSGTIWRSLAGNLHGYELLVDRTDTPFHILISWILTPYKQFPFYERNSKFVFTELPQKILSVLPFFIYSISNVIFQCAIGNLSEIDAIAVINNYIDYLTPAYLDNALKRKSAYRSWLQQVSSNLGKVKVPQYDAHGNIIGTFIRESKEPKWIMKDLPTLEQILQEGTIFKQFANHIRLMLTKPLTPEKVLRAYRVSRIASNTMVFIKSIVETTMEQAIDPNIANIVLEPSKTLLQDSTQKILEYEQPTHPLLYEISKEFRKNIPELLRRVAKIDFNTSAINFLSTRSSGSHASLLNRSESSRSILRSSNKRAVRFSLESKSYTDPTIFNEIRAPTIAGSRDAVDRRPRIISIPDNWNLLLSYVDYRILQTYNSLKSYSVSGKQTGNYRDMATILISTSRGYVCGSQDISGMDTHVQDALRTMVSSCCLEVAKLLPQRAYMSFTTQLMDVFKKDGTNIQKEISALHQAVSRGASMIPKPATYTSKLFGEITNRPGTYGSGLAPTSANHTFILGEAINAIRKVINYTTNIDVGVAGDDFLTIFTGLSHLVHKEASTIIDMISSLGFKIKNEISVNTGDFLQQQGYFGRANTHPDRVLPNNAEKPNPIYDVKMKYDEEFSVAQDMASRCEDNLALAIMLWIKTYYTNNRITLSVRKNDLERVLPYLHNKVKWRLRSPDTKIAYDGKHFKITSNYELIFLQLYIPIFYCFIREGGNLPPPGLLRKNGTYTTPCSILYARGDASSYLLHDLSIDNGYYNDNKIVDDDYLRQYEAQVAANIALLRFGEIEKRAKSTKIDYDEIQKLGNNMAAHGDTALMSKSFRAHSILAQHGINVPTRFVYAYTYTTKLLDAITELSLEKSDVILVGNKVMTELMKELTVYHFNIKKHAYICIPNSEIIPLKHHYLKDITIAPNLAYGTSGYNLLQLFGHETGLKHTLLTELNRLKDTYGDFRYDDPRIELMLQVRSKQEKLLDVLFDAMGLSPRERAQYMNLLNYYRKNIPVIYKFTLSGRLMFFINTDTTALTEHVTDSSKNSFFSRLIRISEREDAMRLSSNRHRSALVLIATHLYLHKLQTATTLSFNNCDLFYHKSYEPM